MASACALIVWLALSAAGAGAQSHPRRPLADEIASGLPEEIFSPPYNAIVTELILPPGSVHGITVPFPVTRVRYSAVPFFAFDSAALSDRSRRTTHNISILLRSLPDIAAIVVVGHTDSIGTDAYNIDLSKRRAEAVEQALIEDGVPSRLIRIIPLGESYPIAMNATDGGRALNRRVEFYISSRAEAAREAPRSAEFQSRFQNTHPACRNGSDPSGCAQPGSGEVPIYDANGRQDGVIDMSRPINASARVVRRPLPQAMQQRRPLPQP
jgi:outer membrane protein OmpA-like peptidoglycan-associated protein